MNRNLLVISVTAAMVAAGATSATTMHNKHKLGETARYAAPSQPIPYDQLDSYIKGSRSDREKIESQAGTAGTQTAQAGVTSPPMSSDNTAPRTSVTPDTGAAPTGAMANPAPDNTGSAGTPSTSGDATAGAPMNGPATPSASPNTPQ